MNTKKTCQAGLHAILPVLALLAACSPSKAQTSAHAEGKQNSIQKGRYIVEQVAMCIDCHSPRTETGTFDQARWLQGGPLLVAPTVPIPWAAVAPSIAGLPGYTKDQAVRFFMTGERPNGNPLRPPMPAFRMNQADAESVTDYLLSLRKS